MPRRARRRAHRRSSARARRSSRARAWGGDLVPPRVLPSFGEVDLAVVHHTESANEYTAEQSAGIVLAITKFHRDTRGWNDVGYNFLVDRFGTIFEGRAGGVDLAGDRRARTGLQQHLDGDLDHRLVHGGRAAGGRHRRRRPADRLAPAARRASRQRSGDRHLRRRVAEPLPQRACR